MIKYISNFVWTDLISFCKLKYLQLKTQKNETICVVFPWASVYMSQFSSRFWIYSELTVTNVYVFLCRFINYWKARHHWNSRNPNYTYRHIWPQVLLETITAISTAECRAGGLSKVCYMNKMYQDPLKQL